MSSGDGPRASGTSERSRPNPWHKPSACFQKLPPAHVPRGPDQPVKRAGTLSDDLLVVHLQTDLIGIPASLIFAPLREVGRHAAFPGLTPQVEIGGAQRIVK